MGWCGEGGEGGWGVEDVGWGHVGRGDRGTGSEDREGALDEGRGGGRVPQCGRDPRHDSVVVALQRPPPPPPTGGWGAVHRVLPPLDSPNGPGR